MVLLHQNSDQQHGDHHHLPGSFLLPAPGVQNTQQVFRPYIFLISLLKCRLLIHWFVFPSKKYVALVSLAIIVRPTALIVWLPLLIYHFWKEDDKLKLVTHTFFPIGLVPLIQRPPSFF